MNRMSYHRDRMSPQVIHVSLSGIGFVMSDIVLMFVVVVFIDTERSVLTHESYKIYNTHT